MGEKKIGNINRPVLVQARCCDGNNTPQVNNNKYIFARMFVVNLITATEFHEHTSQKEGS